MNGQKNLKVPYIQGLDRVRISMNLHRNSKQPPDAAQVQATLIL